jgi:hypothetical protein
VHGQAASEALARRSDWSSRRTKSNTGRRKIGDSTIQHGRHNPWPCGRILDRAHGPVKARRGDDRETLVGLSAGRRNLPGARLGSEQAAAREKSHAAGSVSSGGENKNERGKSSHERKPRRRENLARKSLPRGEIQDRPGAASKTKTEKESGAAKTGTGAKSGKGEDFQRSLPEIDTCAPDLLRMKDIPIGLRQNGKTQNGNRRRSGEKLAELKPARRTTRARTKTKTANTRRKTQISDQYKIRCKLDFFIEIHTRFIFKT